MAHLQPLLRASLRFRSIATPRASFLWRRNYSTPPEKSVNTTSEQAAPASPTPETTTFEDKGIERGPDSIKITNSKGYTLEWTHLRLRDSCACPLCVDKHSKQRNFRMSDIPLDIKLKTIKVEGKNLIVTWENDIPGFSPSHFSRFGLAYLQTPVRNSHQATTGRKRPRLLWGKEVMNTVKHWISYEDYMHNDTRFTQAMRNLASAGMIFVKDIPDSREMVEKVATRMGPLRNTFYGPTWDVRQVPKAKNVAYTSQFLGFHMDLMYMNEPPGYQLLHCLRNSCDGGESLFADTFKIAHEMLHKYPEYFLSLTQTHLNYGYSHKENNYANTWPVFEVGFASSRGSPLSHVNYSPPFQAPLINPGGLNTKTRKQNVELSMKALKHFADSLECEENIFELKLKPGECVIFENRRIAHARRQFNTTSGERWLAGAYVDEDAVLSRFRVLTKAYRKEWSLSGPAANEYLNCVAAERGESLDRSIWTSREALGCE
ncbi:hypothetical protein BJX70DRAFT_388321 [Aspergillus crustosus]